MNPMTEWGIAVKKQLVERRMTVEDLAQAIGAKNAQYIRDVMYGYKPGKKHKPVINKYLGLDA